MATDMAGSRVQTSGRLAQRAAVRLGLLAVLSSSMLALPFLVFVVLVAVWAFKRHRHFTLRERLGLRGPPASFWSGNLVQLQQHRRKYGMSKSPLWRQQILQQYGKTCGLYLGTMFEIMSVDLEFAREVMITQFANFVDRENLSLHDAFPMEMGLLQITNGGKRGIGWKDVRSIVSPVFTSGKMKKMHGTIGERVDAFVEALTAKTTRHASHEIDIYDEWQALTLDTIARVAFGVDCDSISNRNDVFYTNCQAFFRTISLDQAYIVMPLAFTFPLLGPLIRRFAKFTEYERPLITRLEEAVNKRKQKSYEAKDDRPDLIELLLEQDRERERTENKPPLGDEVIISNCYSFLLAGYETTSTALTYCTWLLAKHPEVQERLYDEIMSVFGEEDEIDYERVMRMEYCDCVFRETLRILPPVALFTARRCIKETTVCGIKIPVGANVSVPVQCVHWDETYWPNPTEFDPDRFASAEVRKSPAWMPFGVGPRHCVGLRFAEMEFKTAIVAVLRKFVFSVKDPEEELQTRISAILLRPLSGVNVIVSQRA